MRKDLMEVVLGAASAALFAEAVWSGSPNPVQVYQGGGDVDFDMFGATARRATHWFRGVKASFPGLAAGQTLIVDGVTYEIVDKRTPQDAPLEWEIAAAEVVS
ncbi:MAG TPA: hypothetical protein VGN60_00795 [Devosia sp.]|nr:hypothetical protein [Devosia sp.]